MIFDAWRLLWFGRGSGFVRSIIAGSSLQQKSNPGNFRFTKMAA